LRKLAVGSDFDRLVRFAATGLRLLSEKAVMSGCPTHDPLLIVSAVPNAAWLTIRGPYVVDPDSVDMPLAGM
jgi:hypothetical protein